MISGADLSRETKALTSKTETFEGGCTCRTVRYRLTSRPLFVHCCHCRWCQCDSGTAFAMNAMIEADRLPPDIHIFTMSKQPRVALPAGVPAVEEYYDRNELWPQESVDRLTALTAKAAT